MRPGDRLLVPVTYGFAVRYLLPTGVLDRLREVCEPVIGLGWEDAELEAELRDHGVEVVALPQARLGHDYRMFRRRMAVAHERRLASPTSRIRRARDVRGFDGARARTIAHARRALDVAALARPGAAAALDAREAAVIDADTNAADFERFLADHRIDAVLSITPYHDQDGLLLRAAARRGVGSITSVISFDNPTTRARLLARSDLILVWNRHNAEELARAYPDLGPTRVRVIGAPQFDLHHRSDLVVDRATWAAGLGIAADRPVILYGAGPAHLVPGEERLVLALDAAIDDGRIAGEPFLLVRRHPVDDGAQWRAPGARLRHGRVVDPWAPGSSAFRGWPRHGDLVDQMSSLAHAEVHVNVCSSMTLDGAVFDRPQVGPTFVPGLGPRDARQIRDLYRQEHWWPVTASGGLATADDEAALVREVAAGLADPGARRSGRRALLEDLLTDVDGGAGARLVAAVAGFDPGGGRRPQASNSAE